MYHFSSLFFPLFVLALVAQAAPVPVPPAEGSPPAAGSGIPDTVVRKDRRLPDEVERVGGLPSRAVTNNETPDYDLKKHVLGADTGGTAHPDSAYVSFTKDEDAIKNFKKTKGTDVIYTGKPNAPTADPKPTWTDVNDALGPHKYDKQKEVAAAPEVPLTQIESAKIRKDGQTVKEVPIGDHPTGVPGQVLIPDRTPQSQPPANQPPAPGSSTPAPPAAGTPGAPSWASVAAGKKPTPAPPTTGAAPPAAPKVETPTAAPPPTSAPPTSAPQSSWAQVAAKPPAPPPTTSTPTTSTTSGGRRKGGKR